jgi:hypothetical protein
MFSIAFGARYPKWTLRCHNQGHENKAQEQKQIERSPNPAFSAYLGGRFIFMAVLEEDEEDVKFDPAIYNNFEPDVPKESFLRRWLGAVCLVVFFVDHLR